MIDWIELARAIPYAGTAVIFGLFMVLILRQNGQQRAEVARLQDEKDERLAASWAEQERERDRIFTEAMERRDKDWRDFLQAQQQARGEQWSAVVQELKHLSALTIHSTDLLREHDAWERGLLITMQQRALGLLYPPSPPPPKTGDKE